MKMGVAPFRSLSFKCDGLVLLVLMYLNYHSLHNNIIMAMVMVYMLCFQKHIITKGNIPEELHPAEI